MQRSAPSWLGNFIEEVAPKLQTGKVSTFLPELAAAGSGDFGVALYLGEDNHFSYGSEHKFTIQSVIKVITLLIAIGEHGLATTVSRVGCDRSFGAYNDISNYDQVRARTANPFVNAGALVTLDMLSASGSEGLVDKVLACARNLTGNPNLQVSMSVARSEYDLSLRNRLILDHLASHRAISHTVDDLLWAYCQICSIEVDVVDLAHLAFVLSRNAGIDSDVLKVASEDIGAVRRLLLAVGMYEASSEYAFRVGVPSKGGVSGSMIGVLPGMGGVGIYGPALDHMGNSVGGIEMMKLLAQHFKVI